MKSLHIALGLGGALLLFGGKKKAGGAGEIVKAGAIGAAESASQTIGAGTESNEMQLQTEAAEVEILEDHLAPPALGDSKYTYGPDKAPTPSEFAQLYSISPLLATRAVPSSDLRRHLTQQIASDPRLTKLADRSLSNTQKITLGVQMLTPAQTRLFAADCLELALPVFEKEFPGDSAGTQLVSAIRRFSAKDPNMGAEQMQNALGKMLNACAKKGDKPAIQRLMETAVFASLTKDNFAPLMKTAPERVRNLMLGALQSTRGAAIEARKMAAQDVAYQKFRKDTANQRFTIRDTHGNTPPTGAAAIKNEALYRNMEARLAAAEKSAVRDTEQSILNSMLKKMVR